MDNKDEMIEDISVDSKPEEILTQPAEVSEEALSIEPESPKVEEVVQEPVSYANINNPAEAVEVIDEVSEGQPEPVVQYETVNDAISEQPVLDSEVVYTEKSSKSKKVIIIVLSILLVLDVAALIIYLIGVDKVLGFVK